MSRRPTLPRIVGFRLKSFQPFLQKDLDVKLLNGANVILGGNGQGKTTIMQALVYALAGPLGEAVEPIKQNRWNQSYFHGRLGADGARAARVEVDFSLGTRTFTIVRGFASSVVLECHPQGIPNAATALKAQDYYEDIITTVGGYASIDDFAVVVHLLLYLPESRRLIAWNADAQRRLLMLLNGDIISEQDFREDSTDLKELDSKRRHHHVTLQHARRRLEEMRVDSADPAQGPDGGLDAPDAPDAPGADTQGNGLEELQRVTKARATGEKALVERTHALSARSSEIESLRDTIETMEAEQILGSLTDLERAEQLPLHQLVDRGTCPSCGTYQPGLQARAKAFLNVHQCVLCGSDDPRASDSPEIATLRSQMAEKLASQRHLAEQWRAAETRVATLRSREASLLALLTQAPPVVEKTIATLLERKVEFDVSEDSLRKTIAELEEGERVLALEYERQRAELLNRHEAYWQRIGERSEDLRGRYERYATAFLGTRCVLIESLKSDRLLPLPTLIPSFSGVARARPEECSEAQRFFLDIAFRMAVVEWATNAAKSQSCFLCETPENALDMSYMDNVVDLFSQFTEGGNDLLVTANIQVEGLARRLLERIPEDERHGRVVNLLEVGRLSDVQKNRLDDMYTAMKGIL